MTGFSVMLKKELRGNLRTHRLLIVTAVFVVMGLGTPLLLKYMHLLVPNEGVGIDLPVFTAFDVVGEYFSTLGQFGLVAAILVAMGAVAREREWGTAAMTLSKPVGTGVFILAKLVALAVVFGIAMLVGALGCYLYTAVLFHGVGGWEFLAGNLLVGLYLLVCIAVTLMTSCFFKNQLGCGAVALVLLIFLTAISAVPALRDYSPGALPSWGHGVVSGEGQEAWGALAVSMALVVLSTIVGWRVFRTKEL